jgi:hypothetical protein
MKAIAKTLFLLVLLLLLVLIGLENRQIVELRLPPLLPKAIKFQAAIMYFGFFAVGLFTGVVLRLGGGGAGRGGTKKSSGGK